ncbi:hypothetical protein K503DRAFT_870974 [Rhizopogon vinicolor AM-OR11-026]|uniref:Uncharacterized protein n=1 Tax=Rhizopogon vinicolor AM-OR11-026 TaxID=1314800 RepID=A0A1B7MD61_9AGAM|nr:hypothetical protein K503DRAFT_870974 [Rhizopogon vinicolor AM-OR11-026]
MHSHLCIQGIDTISESSLSKWTSNTVTPAIQFGIAIILILEYSFFLSQQGNQKLGKVIELAAAEYKTKAAAEVEKADDHRYYFAEPHVWVSFILELNFNLIGSPLATVLQG